MMIEISIPGRGTLQCRYLVLDYNGTLAVDGRLIEGVREALQQLSNKLEIHVLTADTFGKARSGLTGIDCKLSILPIDRQDIGKREYVIDLGAEFSVCIGNGRNDRLMLKEASLGIALIQKEGAAAETLLAADVVCSGIVSALELFNNPLRLVATLRS
jgi:soluble P-type ATPase